MALSCPEDIIGQHRFDSRTRQCTRCGLSEADVKNYKNWDEAKKEVSVRRTLFISVKVIREPGKYLTWTAPLTVAGDLSTVETMKLLWDMEQRFNAAGPERMHVDVREE